jgi:hypothetical protein
MVALFACLFYVAQNWHMGQFDIPLLKILINFQHPLLSYSHFCKKKKSVRKYCTFSNNFDENHPIFNHLDSKHTHTHTQKHGLESLENTQEHKEKLAYVQLFVSFKNISIHDDAMTKLWDFQTP